MREEPRSELKSRQWATGASLSEVLPFLVGLDRTGRLSAAQEEAPGLEVWIERGRVVDAAWGRMRALSALEMGAVFLPRANFVFSDGLHSATRTFDLGPTDLAARLAEVAREGAGLAGPIPGPDAVPARLEPPPARLARDPEAVRLLDQIDGRRSVAELVEGRQPLVVLRGLASLVQQGAIGFQPAAPPATAVGSQPPSTPPSSPTVAEVHWRTAPASQAPAWHGRLAALGINRPATRFVLVGLALVVLAFVVIDSLQTLSPEAEVPTDVSPAVTLTGARTQRAVLPTLPQPVRAARTPAQQATAAPTLAQPAAAAPTAAQQATAAPTLAQPSVAAPAAEQGPAPSPTAALRTLLDESFTTGAPGWPNAATSSAWWDSVGYHLEPRLAGKHVAIAAPASSALGDVEVAGVFRKSGGPPGGGYGLILRAQGGPLDGINQGGRYYVFEAGDRGELGAWRREENKWVELVPWTGSSAVHTGDSENRLAVRAAGSQFTFSVNDTPVAQITDDTLPSGVVGVFTGGDGNQVLLERFTLAAL
jgi:hypothetical protein